ncbi:hypothetical protein [Persephonella sp.]
MAISPEDLYPTTKEEFKKKLEKGLEEKKSEIKQTVEEFLPDPAKKMLQTEEGTYALIAIAIVMVLVILKAVGVAMKFFLKLVLFLSIAAAIYFSYLYFTNY